MEKKGTKILIAEDEVIVAIDIKSRLQNLGYQVCGMVTRGEEVLQKVPEVNPDLILMDIMLDGKLDGIETAKEIRKSYDIPIIYLTASSDEKTLERSKETQPYGFILKPFEARELHTTIEIAFIRQQMEEKIKESEERFKALVENSSDAVIVLDNEDQITYLSDSTKHVLGYDYNDLINTKIIEIVHPDFKDLAKNELLNLLNSSQKSSKLQLKVRHKNGNWLWIETFNKNLLDLPYIKGIVINFRDITAEKEYQDEIKRSHARFESLVNSSIVGIVITDTKWNVKEANEIFLNMLGYNLNEFKNNKIDWMKVFSLESKILDQKAIKQLESQGYCTAYERVYKKKNGEEVPVLIGATKLEGHNEETECVWFTIDITERKKIENSLRETNETLNAIIQASPLGIVSMTAEINPRESKVTLWNEAAEKIFGWKRDEILYKNLDIVPDEFLDESIELRSDIIKGKKITNYESIRQRKNGKMINIELSSSCIKDENGKVEGILSVYSDISEKKEMEKRMYYLSFYDQMTGLPNEVLFNDRLSIAIANAKRNDNKCAVLFIDLDNFKYINTKYGHIVGDKMIISIAKKLTNAIRETDTISRRGGDEFILLITDVDNIDSITKVVTKIFNIIEQPIRYKNKDIKLTFSLGIAVYPDTSLEQEDLIVQADMAMYEAKKLGGNNYKFFTEIIN